MTEDSVRIRVADEGDVEAVLALEREVPEAPHWHRGEYDAIFAGERAPGAVRRRLFLAESEIGLLGFSVGAMWGSRSGADFHAMDGEVRRGGWGVLESVAVRGSARRSGLGRALCVAVLAWCGAEGARQVELEVRSASGGAVALYRQLGFEVTGRRAAYYTAPPDEALLMEARLGGVDEGRSGTGE